MTDNTRVFNIFPVFFRKKKGGFLCGERRAKIGGYRDGSRSGTMSVFTPGATEKPRTEVGAFLNRIWRTW